ncbi:Hypothetical predicted protein [Mytilus galloprovincialis]|uniref:C-type lectin domain-containing protein n=1 Tax=Mytilus galloprovincialis TaxID=29158 RepID=A0A8B6EKE5_MYTGA|nr:Hypothetical predicted protein [Mytilus galloprovincialis]
MYAFIELAATWNEAVSNCTCHGGHLAEIETLGENDFITNELSIRQNRGIGYWLGGYNFNGDSDLEWISKPTDCMPFTNWYPEEPNLKLDEHCLIAFRWGDFKWHDLNCALLAPYVCEF